MTEKVHPRLCEEKRHINVYFPIFPPGKISKKAQKLVDTVRKDGHIYAKNRQNDS